MLIQNQQSVRNTAKSEKLQDPPGSDIIKGKSHIPANVKENRCSSGANGANGEKLFVRVR